MIIANAQVFMADGFFEKKHIFIKDSIITDVIDVVPDNDLEKKYPEDLLLMLGTLCDSRTDGNAFPWM